MTTNALPVDTPSADEVAAYLRRHPAFLIDYPELAARLTVPSDEGPVASLAVYQLKTLRERNVELEKRLAELIAIATENEALMQRVHDLNVTMLRANTPAVAARGVMTRLAADFGIDQVRLVLFGDGMDLPPADWLMVVPGGREAIPELVGWNSIEPLVGRLSAERVTRLFGADTAALRSAAVTALGGLGLLALGSNDENRFQPGLGSLFLDMIAATLTAALLRLRDP